MCSVMGCGVVWGVDTCVDVLSPMWGAVGVCVVWWCTVGFECGVVDRYVVLCSVWCLLC